MANTLYNVKNRSASRVCYTIPEDNIRRSFAPGETKKISEEELTKLSYQPGGPEMMIGFLQIQSDEMLNNLNINAQPEYYMSEEQVVELIKTGSYDAFLDCLDFAPVGVIDLIKQYAVSLPMEDYKKKQALENKTGFNVDAAIKNSKADKESEKESENIEASATVAPTGRRTSASYKAEEKKTTTSKYNVVSKN